MCVCATYLLRHDEYYYHDFSIHREIVLQYNGLVITGMPNNNSLFVELYLFIGYNNVTRIL